MRSLQYLSCTNCCCVISSISSLRRYIRRGKKKSTFTYKWHLPRHWGVYKATHLPDSETQLFPTRRRVASRHLWDYVSPEPCWWPDSWNLSRRAPPTERESSGRGLAAKTLPPALPSWFGKADLQTAVPADLRSRQWSLLRRCGAAPGQHPVNSLLSFPLPETPGQTL